MAIRLPLKNVGTFTAATSETGGSSVAGGIPYLVTLPQDTDEVVVKFTASVAGAGYSATFQTTDDGGTTWWDCARSSIVSNANSTVTAEWMPIPVITQGIGKSVLQTTSSVYVATVGRAGASTLGANQQSGLPILSQQARIFVRITGDVTDAAANTYVAQVLVNNQDATS